MVLAFAGPAVGQARPETPVRPAETEAPARSPAGGAAETPARQAASPVAGDERVSPEAALAAFEIVRGWVDRGAVPDAPEPGLPAVPVASVTIRDAGAVIGRDTAVATTPEEEAGVLQRAASRAVRRAITRLEGEPDALRAERVRTGLSRVTLSIELASGPAVPVPEGVGGQALDEWVRPGLEGLLLRRGADPAATTPGTMLTAARPASSVLVGLVATLADDPADALRPFGELEAEGWSLALFRTVHVAEIASGAAPLILHRGGAIAGPVQGKDELVDLAGLVARHIERCAWPGVERLGLRGTLDAVSGRFDPPVGSPFAQAFAAESLLRYASLDEVGVPAAARARAAAIATLEALAIVEEQEAAPWAEPESAAACVAALARLDAAAFEGSPELRALRERCVPALREAFGEADGFDPAIAATGRGVVARGLLALASLEPWRAERHLATADAAIRRAFAETDPAMLLGLMPDLAWAEIDLNRRRGFRPPSAQALRGLRDEVLGWQIRRADVEPIDADLRGAFVLNPTTSPLPTWQSLRPAAMLASMLGDPTLTRGTIASGGSGEVAAQVVRLTEAMRFLKQLSAGRRTGFMYADPELAFGGVRAAPWQQSMPLAAQALGLAALTEAIDALDRVATRQGPEDPRPEVPVAIDPETGEPVLVPVPGEGVVPGRTPGGPTP